MCEVVTKIIFQGKSYLSPFHPEYEVLRLQKIQQAFLPLIGYLEKRFKEGSIYLTWDDDKITDQIILQTSKEIGLHAAINSCNEFIEVQPDLSLGLR